MCVTCQLCIFNDTCKFTTVYVFVINQERAKAEKINRKLRQQLADFRVPEVLEYVREKADLYDIQKKVRSWERKVDIAQVCYICPVELFHIRQTN